MADRIVVRSDLPAQVEELIVLVGRERLLDLLRGARSWDLQREPGGLSLSVGGVPVIFEDGSEGSWVPAVLGTRHYVRHAEHPRGPAPAGARPAVP
jgi:hypothetical protein